MSEVKPGQTIVSELAATEALKPGRIAKKPYHAPGIEESAQFETLALSCAKQEEVSGCATGPSFNS